MDGSGTALTRTGTGAPLQLRFDGEHRIEAASGETVSVALLAADVLATSRSVKYRRPRGPYCLTGDCGTCLVRIAGRPNVRACLTPCANHLTVESQNVVGSGPDPTALADTMFGKRGMDHHHFMVKPRMLNEVMKGIARNLAGLGQLPTGSAALPARARHHAPEVLVIGGGPAGMAALEAASGQGARAVLAERFPALGTPPPNDVLRGVGVFGVYTAEGLVAGCAVDLVHGDTLHTFSPQHVIFALGGRDTLPPLVGNDLPGVVSARGLLRQLHGGTATAGRCVVVGPAAHAKPFAQSLRAPAVEPADVIEIVGDDRVEGVRTSKGLTPCELVALAPIPSPASELPRQGGAEVAWNGVGFAVVRDDEGRVASQGPWQAWACGDVCGFMGAPAAAADGRAVGTRVADALAMRASK